MRPGLLVACVLVPGLGLAGGGVGTVEVAAQAPAPGATAGAEWVEWVESWPVDPRAGQEILRFETVPGEGLPLAYAEALLVEIRQDIRRRVSQRVAQLQGGACDPFVSVDFGPSALASPGVRSSGAESRGTPGAARFEQGLVRIEVVACLDVPGARSAEALALYTDPAFRREAERRIRAIWEEGQESCVETTGVPRLLAPGSACNRIQRFAAGTLASEFSQIVSNGGAQGFQTVYLKESVKTFVETPSGLAFHYVNVSRSADLGRLSRWVGERSIRESEHRKVGLLTTRLAPGDSS